MNLVTINPGNGFSTVQYQAFTWSTTEVLSILQLRKSKIPHSRIFILKVELLFLAATKQLYEWYFLSVCPSVRLSVCPSVCPSVRLSVCLSVRLSVCPSVTPFWLCSHHRIIMKFSGVITFDQGKVHAKGQGQRSKVKVTEVTTQIFVSGL